MSRPPVLPGVGRSVSRTTGRARNLERRLLNEGADTTQIFIAPPYQVRVQHELGLSIYTVGLGGWGLGVDDGDNPDVWYLGNETDAVGGDADPPESFVYVPFLADGFGGGQAIYVNGKCGPDYGILTMQFGNGRWGQGPSAGDTFVPESDWFDVAGTDSVDFYNPDEGYSGQDIIGGPFGADTGGFFRQLFTITEAELNKPGTAFDPDTGIWDGGPGMYTLKIFCNTKNASSSGYRIRLRIIVFQFDPYGSWLS